MAILPAFLLDVKEKPCLFTRFPNRPSQPVAWGMHRGTLALPGPGHLDLDSTLSSGQVFRWRRNADGLWKGMVGNQRLSLQVDPTGTQLHWCADGPDPEATVRRFLRWEDVDVPELARAWSVHDPAFDAAWSRYPGLRILRQDRHECFFSFLLASAAPVSRISHLCHALADECGSPLGDGWTVFPDARALAALPEQRLRAMGLGFRAPRIAAAARHATQNPGFLEAIPSGDRDALHAAIDPLLGIGPKIADCIALFAFDCDDAVPVDTHVWRLTQTVVDTSLAGKSLTAANYGRARDAWIRRYGPKAGWAQQTLFHDAAQRRLRS